MLAVLAVAGCQASEGKVPNAEKADLQPVDLSPSLAKPAGLETQPIIIQTPEERLTRLEKAVMQLRSDINVTKAQLTRLSDIEDRLDVILAEVKGIKISPVSVPLKKPEAAKNTSQKDKPETVAKSVDLKEKPDQKKTQSIYPPARKPELKKAEIKGDSIDKVVDEALDQQKTSKAVSQKSEAQKPISAAISAVRVGEHADKTRIVLESSTPLSYTTDVDNAEKIVLIDLKSTGWNADQERKFSNSPFVSSYAVQADGAGGQRLVLTLKKAVKLKSYAIKAEGVQPNRLVLDLVGGP